MATVIRFPERISARPVGEAGASRPSATVTILPCIRREALAPIPQEAPSVQLHA